MINNSIALDLVKTMDVAHVSEFQILVTRFAAEPGTKEATVKDLISIASHGFEESNIRAVKLIGVLKVCEAESALLDIFESRFNKMRLMELQKLAEKTSLEYQYLTSMLATLILIKSENGQKIACAVKTQFKNTWISSYLDEIQKAD